MITVAGGSGGVAPGAGGPQVGGICIQEFRGHEYAVKKVQWSPHRGDLLASAGYDMSCRMCVVLRRVCIDLSDVATTVGRQTLRQTLRRWCTYKMLTQSSYRDVRGHCLTKA